MRWLAITLAVLSLLLVGFSSDRLVPNNARVQIEVDHAVPGLSPSRIIAHRARELFVEKVDFIEALNLRHNRLLRWNGDTTSVVPPNWWYLAVVEIANDPTVLFLCTTGGLLFFNTDKTDAVAVPGQENDSGCYPSHGPGQRVASTYYLPSETGIIRWRPGERSTTLSQPMAGRSLFEVQEYGRGIVINTGRETLLWMPDSASKGPFVAKQVRSFRGWLWYFNSNSRGLYRWRPGQQPAIVIDGIGRNLAVFDDTLFVETYDGVFFTKLPQSPLQPLYVNGIPIDHLFETSDDLLLLGSRRSTRLYLWRRHRGSTFGTRVEIPDVPVPSFRVLEAGGALWISAVSAPTIEWFFFLEPGSQTAIQVRKDFDFTLEDAVMDPRGVWWISTSGGLMRWGPSKQDPAQLVLPGAKRVGIAGRFLGIQFGDSLLKVPWDPAHYKIDLLSPEEPFPAPGSSPTVSWELPPELPASEILSYSLITSCDGNRQTLQPQRKAGTTWSAIYTVPAKPGDCRLQIEAADFWGKRKLSNSQTLSIGRSITSRAKAWLEEAISSYAALNVLVFLGLACGAHWQPSCLRLLAHPAIRKSGLYFGLALELVPLLRIWVLRPYFIALKDRYQRLPELYVPVDLRKQNGDTVDSGGLLGQLKGAKLLVKGPSGSGKTVLTRSLLQSYVKERSLWAAWRRYGFVPLPIALRELTPQKVPGLVQSALGGFEVHFEDEKLVGRLLKQAGFLLLLDGLNETSLDSTVLDFAASNKATALLLTSQTALGSDKIVEYDLPAVDAALAEKLLRKFLGDQRGQEVAERAKTLLPQLTSGYDVRILADLADQGEDLPADRIGLYARMLDRLSGTGFRIQALTRRAWDGWRSGERQFNADKELTANDLLALESPPGEPAAAEGAPRGDGRLPARPVTTPHLALVVRRGLTYEFRHDQLRAFLAAHYLAKDVTSAAAESLLSQEQVWQAAVNDQADLYPFFADLLPSDELAQQYADFAVKHLARYQILLQALQATCRTKAWPLRVDLNPPLSEPSATPESAAI